MSNELKNAKERGADIKQIAKLVEVSGLSEVVAQLLKISEQNKIAQTENTDRLVKAIDSLIEVVAEKEIKGADLSGLIEAVKSLKQEATVTHPQPHEWEIGFERDQRGFMKSGVKLIPVPRVIN